MTRWIGIAVITAFGSVACGGSAPQPPSAPSASGTLLVASATRSFGDGSSGTVGDPVEIEGRIESLPPTQPAETLVVDGRTVTVSAETVIRQGDTARTFADLAIGQRVHVKGTLGAAAIAAAIITIQNTTTSIPVNVNGTVTSLTGDASAFTVIVDGREVRGDATTVFYGDGGVAVAFGALAVGSRVEVKGLQQDGYVFAERIHINGTGKPGEPQDESASVEGRLNTLGGAAPTLTLTIGSTTVTTTAATEVQRRGAVLTLADLAEGQTVHAVGTRLADASIVARQLQIKDDESGGTFAVNGSMGGLKGTCPAITFGVNGYSIYTTTATTFGPGADTCTSLKSGTKVGVTGVVQANGTVKAETVTRK